MSMDYKEPTTKNDLDELKRKMFIEEMAYLEWINRALKYQIQINENRLAEIDKELIKEEKRK